MIARPVADHQLRVVGVVGREGTPGTVVGAGTVQHGAAVVLEVLRCLISICLTVIILCRWTVSPIPWHKSGWNVRGIVSGDEGSSRA